MTEFTPPPLPDPVAKHFLSELDYFSAEQMIEYAKAYAEAMEKSKGDQE